MSVEHSLQGVRVAVTRPEEAATELVAGLLLRGARVSVHPLIRIAPPEDAAALRDAAARVTDFDWVVLTSVNAVYALLAALEQAETALRPGAPRVAAVGSATAAELARAGIAVDVVPHEFVGRALPEAMMQLSSLAGARVLLPRSAIGREELPALLREAGARVSSVVAYRTVPDEAGAAGLAAALAAGALDVVTFTSPSTVRSLAEVCPVLPPQVRVVVIGPSTAAAAREAGYPVHGLPGEYSSAGLVAALEGIMAEGERR